MSTPEFGIPTLRLLAQDSRFEVVAVVSQPDKPAGRGLLLTPPPVKIAAQELGLTLFQPPNLRRSPEVWNAIRALEPDVGAVAAYGQWIPSELFDLPPKRSLNLHPSKLPRHRGAAPVVSTILAGEQEVGLSVLFVEDEMDAGDLLAQQIVPIGETETTGEIMARLAEIGAPFFADTLADWVAGKITPQPQDHSQATWIDRLEKQAGLIDWTLPATEIARRCRAFSPWPGTFTFFEGQRLILHVARAQPFPNVEIAGLEPGRVMQTDSAEVAVVTGEGLLRLDVVQLESRRQLKIADFVRGQPRFIQTRLG